jgi:hypothetical protein
VWMACLANNWPDSPARAPVLVILTRRTPTGRLVLCVIYGDGDSVSRKVLPPPGVLRARRSGRSVYYIAV